MPKDFNYCFFLSLRDSFSFWDYSKRDSSNFVCTLNIAQNRSLPYFRFVYFGRRDWNQNQRMHAWMKGYKMIGKEQRLSFCNSNDDDNNNNDAKSFNATRHNDCYNNLNVMWCDVMYRAEHIQCVSCVLDRRRFMDNNPHPYNFLTSSVCKSRCMLYIDSLYCVALKDASPPSFTPFSISSSSSSFRFTLIFNQLRVCVM